MRLSGIVSIDLSGTSFESPFFIRVVPPLYYGDILWSIFPSK